MMISPNDPRITWQGAISFQDAGEWLQPWRLPYEDLALFPPDALRERAAMPAGVRISFHSDATTLAGRIEPSPEASPLDLLCDGLPCGSAELAGRSSFAFHDLPPGEKVTCAMRKGSVLFIHENMPHRGLWNLSDHVRWAIDLRWQRPSDPTGLEGQLIRGPRMRKAEDPAFRPDMMAWAAEEREKYDVWVNRADGDPLNPEIDGSWYFARWDPAFGTEGVAGSLDAS